MEFGVVGQDGFVGLGNGLSSPPSDNNGDLKATKIAKLSDDLSLKTNNSISPLKHYSSSFGYCDEHNMLSFSSPKFKKKNLQSSTFPFYQHPNLCYSKSSGYGSVNPSMHFLSGVRGPFTTSQWFELEQQALIYKYIIANEPIPSNLLLPIRRAFESAGFCNFLGGLLRPNTIGYGWGPFHIGFNTTTDPEPGRCRRTDGKKWRCSREAVPDQKYCERHMNRGRHRSRKPVDGHSGHSISKPTINKAMERSISSPLVVSGGGPSNSFTINLDPNKDLLLHSKHLSSSLLDGLMVNKDDNSHGTQDTSRLEFFPHSSGHTKLVSESCAAEFSFLPSDSILSNTTTTRSSTCGSYGQSHPHSSTNDQSSIMGPKTHAQTNRSQLSVSIPPSNCMSTISSPLRLSRIVGSVETSLDVGPPSWETSMGGPLGEVLKTSTSNSSSGSSQLVSSPNGVLHRTALGYFSNSSAGSSPRAENRKTYH